MADAEVIHFIDNQSTLYGMAKGSSPQPDSQALISSLHVHQILELFNVSSGSRTSRPRPTSPTSRRVAPTTPRWPRSCGPSTP
eukprot:1805133-Prymnesium_polylepis.1